MKRAINQLINKELKGVDIYIHNGSMWFIFTKEKRWVFEYTKENVLWYNYSLFNNVFNFVSLDVTENSEYITDWFTKNILDKPLSISGNKYVFEEGVISIIENGVKETEGVIGGNIPIVGRVIEDGVKNIWANEIPNEYNWSEYFDREVEDTIQNGVLSTCSRQQVGLILVEDTIQNGVLSTFHRQISIESLVEDTIQNGVKNTRHFAYHRENRVEDTIQNGVKHTTGAEFVTNVVVEKTIQNGVLIKSIK